MASYRLSRKADRDLEDIFDYGIDAFGLSRAQTYRAGIEERFDLIATNPMFYSAVDRIGPGHRRCVFKKHSIYYKIVEEGVLIVRILGRQDPVRALR